MIYFVMMFMHRTASFTEKKCKMDLSLLWQWHDLKYDLFRNDLHFKLLVGFVSIYTTVIFLYQHPLYKYHFKRVTSRFGCKIVWHI